MAKPPSYNRYVKDCLCCGRELTDQDRNTFREIGSGLHAGDSVEGKVAGAVGARNVCLECQAADQRSTVARINHLLFDREMVPLDAVVINDWIRVRITLEKLTGSSVVSDQVAILQILKIITDHILVEGERFTPFRTHILPLRDVEMFLTEIQLRTKQKYSDPDNYDRDKWLYEQRKLGRTLPDIRDEMEGVRTQWARIDSDSGMRSAIERYCRHHHLKVPQGKRGRPRKNLRNNH